MNGTDLFINIAVLYVLFEVKFEEIYVSVDVLVSGNYSDLCHGRLETEDKAGG